MYWNNHHDDNWGHSGWGFALMALGMLIFLGLIFLTIVLALRQRDQRGRSGAGMVPAHRSAQQILAERFARGEIDETEFSTRSRALQGPEQP